MLVKAVRKNGNAFMRWKHVFFLFFVVFFPWRNTAESCFFFLQRSGRQRFGGTSLDKVLFEDAVLVSSSYMRPVDGQNVRRSFD